MDKYQLLKRTKLFVLDLDGTFYLGNKILDGALSFLEQATASGKKYIFFTNNSSQSPDRYIEKLAGMGCHVERSGIMTSGDVMIGYLKKMYPGKTVYLLGTEPLIQSFENAGIALTNGTGTTPDAVVVGFDKTLTYEKLTNACTYIRNGATFLATHMDINCPMENGFIPDCGAMCAAITLSTGVKPKYTGKPCRETVDMILEATGIERDSITFVGDRLYTDIATGVDNGAMGALVLTGETHESDIAASKTKPDAVYASLGEMGELLKNV